MVFSMSIVNFWNYGRTNEGVLERKHEWFSKEKTLEESPQGTKKWNFTTKISGLIFSYHGALPWWLWFKTRLHLYGAIRGGCVCIGNMIKEHNPRMLGVHWTFFGMAKVVLLKTITRNIYIVCT
jgi:hypothetical protein